MSTRFPPLRGSLPAEPKQSSSPIPEELEEGVTIDPECIAVLEELAEGLVTTDQLFPAPQQQRPTVADFLALVKQKDTAVKSLHSLFAELEQKRAQLDETSEQNSKMLAKLEKMEQLVAGNRGQLDDLAKQRNRVEDLHKRLTEEQTTKEEMESERQALEAEVDALSADTSVLISVARAMKKKDTFFQVELSKLLEEKEVLEQQTNEARQEQEDRITDASRIHTQLSSALERVTTKIQALDKLHGELEDQMSRSKEQALVLIAQVAQSEADKRRREADSVLAAKFPVGDVALVFTDIQHFVEYEAAADAFQKAVKIHDEIIRVTAREEAGVEVKAEGDSFMLAFKSTLAAVQFCMKAQIKLFQADWPPEMMDLKEVTNASPTSAAMFKGLRVRMGVHLCKPQATMDATTGGIEYIGPQVNQAAKIANFATGGQIIISEPAWTAVKVELAECAEFTYITQISLGQNLSEKLYQVLPVPQLKGRTYPQEFTAAHAAKNSITMKYVRIIQLENKLEHLMGVIDKTLNGKMAEADVGEPQSEEALKSRLRVLGAQVAEMKEKIAEAQKRRDQLNFKVQRKNRRVEDLRSELSQKRAERELLNKISEDYDREKQTKDLALVKANAVTFCLLIKQSLLEQQLQNVGTEKDMYEKQAESFQAHTRKLGIVDMKDLDKLSSEQIIQLETMSLGERLQYLEAELKRVKEDIAMYDRMIDDLTKHAQAYSQMEADEKAKQDVAREKEKKVEAEKPQMMLQQAQVSQVNLSPESLLEEQAELQEEMASVNSEVKLLEEQLKSLEERMKSIVESEGSVGQAALAKKQALLQYRVNKALQQRSRLERKLKAFGVIHGQEKALVQEALTLQMKQKEALDRRIGSFQASLQQKGNTPRAGGPTQQK